MPKMNRTTPRGRKTLTLALAAAACGTSVSVNAALVARDLDGNSATAEAYHDTTQGITWMRDTRALANAYGLATTMTHAAATSSLANFNADTTHNHGYSGWRLPGAAGVHTIGGAGCQFGFNGSTDCGSNVDTSSSELAMLFHGMLGNLSDRDSAGQFRPGTAAVDFGLVNEGDFVDLDGIGYWSGTASWRLIFGQQVAGHVTFHMGSGTQSIGTAAALNAAWLVHDGDIGGAVGPANAVPLSSSLSLAAMGLALLGTLRQQRNLKEIA
jgi:hypothetical protein